MSYPGGKEGGGAYQKIINLIPPHDVYIEPFLGGGAVMRYKLPAASNIGIDADTAVIAKCKEWRLHENLQLICGDAISYLKTYLFHGNEFVYLDPPYLLSTRRSGPLYKHEMTETQHRILLSVIKTIQAAVMISGYWSEMYAEALKDWHTISFQVMTRGGKMATEWLWMNYPAPIELHDYRYLGAGFRERERIKRKKARWVNRLNALPLLERQALMSAIKEVF